MPRPPHKNKHSAIEEKEKVISDAGHSFFTPEEIDKVKAPFEMLRSKTSASDQFSEEISIHPEDMGRVIGKQGRIIRAIREVMKLAAAKKQVYVEIVLAETAAPA